jgi:aminoglycoside 3-N-acetyltransferase
MITSKKMRDVTRQQLVEIFRSLGVQAGDGLLIHSALQFLGRPAEGLETYLAALQDVLGDEGTIAVPAFNFDFARGEDYDPASTPSVGMGAFSEYIRQLPAARRTPHPMQSLAVLGKYAQDLAGRDTSSAFDDGSTFDRMLELDFKLLLLGADIQAVAMLHYCEQRAEVPYRHWKEFTGNYFLNGEWDKRTYRMFVRDMQVDAQLVITAIQDELESRELWSQQGLNYGAVALCRLADFVAVADELLAADAWVFVTNRPENQTA